MIVRRLGPDDAEAFAALRLAGLRDRPDAFGSSPEEDVVRDLAATREHLAPGQDDAVFGAFGDPAAAIGAGGNGAAEALVGVAGLHRATNHKAHHHAVVWGMYVAPAAREHGVGRRLLEAVVDHARSIEGLAWLQLGVGRDNAAALALYRSLGFEAWGIERDALRVAGGSVDEIHMRLRLHADARAEPARPSPMRTVGGHCLCGDVRFEIGRVVGPLELCHCPRCRRVSGSAFVSGLMVETRGYRMTAGRELVRRFALPVREQPPPFTTFFCARCGSPVPNPEPEGDAFEIPAGLLEDDPGVSADRHIFVEHRAPWYDPTVVLPEYDRAALVRLRFGRGAARDPEL